MEVNEETFRQIIAERDKLKKYETDRVKKLRKQTAQEEIRFLEDLKKGQHHWLTYQSIKINNRIAKLSQFGSSRKVKK